MQDTLDIVKKADELIKNSEYQLAIDSLNGAVKQIEENPILYEFDVPVVYKKLGQCYGLKGDIEKAHEYLKEGLKFSTRNLNETEKSDILASLAFLELETGELYKALKYAAKAEDIIGEKRGKKFSGARANTLKILGDIYFREGDIEKAEEYYRKTKLIYKKWKLGEQNAEIMLDVVKIRIIEGNYIKAGFYLGDNLLEKLEKKYPTLLSEYYLVLGKLETETKQYGFAKKTFDMALKCAKEQHNERKIAEIYEAIGDLNVREEKREEAKVFYEKAIKHYTERKRAPYIEKVETKLKFL